MDPPLSSLPSEAHRARLLTAEERRSLAAGDTGALERLYREFGDRVYRTALHLLGQPADAEDVTQEIFLGLRARVKSYRGQAAFGNWMYRVTTNHCLSRLSRSNARSLGSVEELGPAHGLEDPAATPEEALSGREQGRRLRELLLRLPAEQRAVLVLREIEELSYREIAQALELPEGTVMSRLSRGRERLRELLEPERSFGRRP